MMCLFFIEMCFALEMLQCFATQHEIKRHALNEMMPFASLNEIRPMIILMSRNPRGLRLISRLRSKHFIHCVNFICRKANFIVFCLCRLISWASYTQQLPIFHHI